MAEDQNETPQNENERSEQTVNVLCAVSKQMVPMEETVGIERKKGEVLRVLAKYKKYE